MLGKKLTVRHSALVLAVAGMAALSGCGDDAAESGVEELIESQSGGDVDVEVDDDGGVAIQTEDGSFSSGTTTELPEEWPEDIPEPDGLAITGATVIGTEGEQAITVVGNVDGEDFVDSYAGALESAGFNEDSTFTSDGTINNVYSNDQWTVSVLYAGEQSENQVTVSVYSQS
jgi:hypothetical protein